MENSSILIGVLGLLAIISPIILFNISRKRRAHKIFADIQAQATKNNGKITDYEYWNNYAIGIDSLSGMVYYWTKIKKNEPVKEINLSQVINFRLTNVRDADFSDNETLVLEFIFADKTTNRNVEFYNSDYDGLTMHNEYQLAEKWLKTIEKCRETLKKK
jgi:hypothetical protein